MRFLVFLMLFPVLANAQSANIPPENVIGFLRLDMNEDGIDERVLLTLDNEGTIDLYIISEMADEPVAFYPDFSATNGDAPDLLATKDGGFEVAQWLRHGQGSSYFSEEINWLSGPNAGYYTTGVSFSFYPRDEDTAETSCTVDFVNGRLETAKNGGEARVFAVNLLPTRPGENLPEGWDEFCGS